MKYTLENDFNKHIKSGEQHRVYLLYGSQPYLIDLYAKLIAEKALDGDLQSVNHHRFDSGNLNLQEVFNAIEQISFFPGGICVSIGLNPDDLSTGELKELCDLLADPPAATVVVIAVRQSPAKKEKLTALIKACDTAGAVMELGARGSSDMSRFLRSRAQRAGCALSGEMASYLLQRCGDDMQSLSAEVDKLCAFVREGEITKEQIDRVVEPTIQARVYDLSKAIFRGDVDRAMHLIEDLMQAREQPARVLAVLSGAYVDLYRGFCARQARIPADQAAKELGYPKNRTFAIKNAMSDSSRYTAKQIGKMLHVLAEADLALKSTGTDDRAVLEQAVMRLFLLGRQQSR